MTTAQKSGEEKGGEYFTGPYEPVPDWPQPISGEEWTWGRVPAALALSPNRILMVQTGELPALDQPMGREGQAGTDYIPNRSAVRAEGLRETNKIVIFDANGRLVESWTQWDHLASFQHRVAVNPHDPERHVWVVDNGFAQIFKFTADGREMVLALGEKNVARQDESHFDGPNDIAFFPNGDFLVADGSRNRRIVRFSKEGKYLMEWGKRSPRPNSVAFTPPGAGRDMSEFGNVHAVAIDAKQRVYVSDWGRGCPARC